MANVSIASDCGCTGASSPLFVAGAAVDSAAIPATLLGQLLQDGPGLRLAFPCSGSATPSVGTWVELDMQVPESTQVSTDIALSPNEAGECANGEQGWISDCAANRQVFGGFCAEGEWCIDTAAGARCVDARNDTVLSLATSLLTDQSPVCLSPTVTDATPCVSLSLTSSCTLWLAATWSDLPVLAGPVTLDNSGNGKMCVSGLPAGGEAATSGDRCSLCLEVRQAGVTASAHVVATIECTRDDVVTNETLTVGFAAGFDQEDAQACATRGACPLACSGHGVCRVTGECACLDSWTGDDCAIPAFVGPPSAPTPPAAADTCFNLLPFTPPTCIDTYTDTCTVGLTVRVGTVDLLDEAFDVADIQELLREALRDDDGTVTQGTGEGEGEGEGERDLIFDSQAGLAGLDFCTGTGDDGCAVCLTWTRVELTDTRLLACAEVTARCFGETIPLDGTLPCIDDEEIAGCGDWCDPTDETACGGDEGRGRCVGGVCGCVGNWRGVHCTYQCPNDCSGVGVCQPTGTCTCDEGHSGPDCALFNGTAAPPPPSPPPPPALSSVCADHCNDAGDCSPTGECSCYPGYEGDRCEEGGDGSASNGLLIGIIIWAVVCTLCVVGGAAAYYRKRRQVGERAARHYRMSSQQRSGPRRSTVGGPTAPSDDEDEDSLSMTSVEESGGTHAR